MTHTLSHRVNLLSIFFFKFFLFIIYIITLLKHSQSESRFFFERGVFFSFFVSYIRFLCCTLWKNMHSFSFFIINIFIRRFYEFFLTCTQSLTGEHLEFTISAFLFRRQRWVWWIIWIFAGTGSSHSGGVSRHFRLWWRWVIPFPAMGAGVEVMASRVSMVGTKFIITSHLEKIKNIYYYILYFFSHTTFTFILVLTNWSYKALCHKVDDKVMIHCVRDPTRKGHWALQFYHTAWI